MRNAINAWVTRAVVVRVERDPSLFTTSRLPLCAVYLLREGGRLADARDLAERVTGARAGAEAEAYNAATAGQVAMSEAVNKVKDTANAVGSAVSYELRVTSCELRVN